MLKEKGYDVKVAHPLMVKAIAYAKVKNDKVDARTLADLLRADMIPESYVPDEKTREVRDLVRRRHDLVETRTGFKNKVKAELATRWVKHEGDVFTQEGRKFLRPSTSTPWTTTWTPSSSWTGRSGSSTSR